MPAGNEVADAHAPFISSLTTKDLEDSSTVSAFHDTLGDPGGHLLSWRILRQALHDIRPQHVVQEKDRLYGLSSHGHTSIEDTVYANEAAQVPGILSENEEGPAKSIGDGGRRLWTEEATKNQASYTHGRVSSLNGDERRKHDTLGAGVTPEVGKGVQVGNAGAGRAGEIIRRPRATFGNRLRILSEEANVRGNRGRISNGGRRSGGPMTSLAPLRVSLPVWLTDSEPTRSSPATGVRSPSSLQEDTAREEGRTQKEIQAGMTGGIVYRVGNNLGEGKHMEELKIVQPAFAELDMPPLPRKKTEGQQQMEESAEQRLTATGGDTPAAEGDGQRLTASNGDASSPLIGESRGPGSGSLEAESRRHTEVGQGTVQKPEDLLDTVSRASADEKEQQDTIARAAARESKADPDDQQTDDERDGDLIVEAKDHDAVHTPKGFASLLEGTEQYLLDFLAQREGQLKTRAAELERQLDRPPPSALLAQIGLVHDLREVLERRFSESTMSTADERASERNEVASDVRYAAGAGAVRSRNGHIDARERAAEASDKPSASAKDSSGERQRSNGNEGSNSAACDASEKHHGVEPDGKPQQRSRSSVDDDIEEERIRERLKVLTKRRLRREAAAAIWAARDCGGLPPVWLENVKDNDEPHQRIYLEELRKFHETIHNSGYQEGDAMELQKEDLRLCPADDEAFAFLREAASDAGALRDISESSSSQVVSRQGSSKDVTCSLWRQGCSVCGCFSGQVVCSRYCVAAAPRAKTDDEAKRISLACCIVEPKETGQLGDLYSILPHTLLTLPYGNWSDGLMPRRRHSKVSPVSDEGYPGEEHTVGSTTAAETDSGGEAAASRTGGSPSSLADTTQALPYAAAGLNALPSSSGERPASGKPPTPPPYAAAENATTTPAEIAGLPPLRDGPVEQNTVDEPVALSTRPSTAPAAATLGSENTIIDADNGVEHVPVSVNNPDFLTQVWAGATPATRATVEAMLQAAARAVTLVGGAQAMGNSSAALLPGSGGLPQQQIEASLLPPRAESGDLRETSPHEKPVDEQGDTEAPATEPDTTNSVSGAQEPDISPPLSTEAVAAESMEALARGNGSPAAGAVAALVQLLQTLPPSPGSIPETVSTEDAGLHDRSAPAANGSQQAGGENRPGLETAKNSPQTQSPLDSLLQLLRQQVEQQAQTLLQQQEQPQQPPSSQQGPFLPQQIQQGQMQEPRTSANRPEQRNSTDAHNSSGAGPHDGPDPGGDLSGRDAGPYLGPPARCPRDCEVFFDGCTTCQCLFENAAPTCRPRWCRRMATAPTCLQVRPSPGPLECPLDCLQTFNGCDLCACDGRGHRLSCRDLCALQNPLQRRNRTGEKRCVRHL